jgi:hypothetical protein
VDAGEQSVPLLGFIASGGGVEGEFMAVVVNGIHFDGWIWVTL